MAITYPLNHPATPEFKRLVMRGLTAAGQSLSPFTFEQQVYLHQGECWAAEATLPIMARASAEAWIAFLLALRGRYGTFAMGDPSAKAPRGSAPNAPAAVDGGSQSGLVLNTLGWTASQNNILLPGDYVQIAKNYATNPRAFDNAAWIKSQCTVTATNITAPNGVAEAERLTPDALATNALCRQIITISEYKARQFAWYVWLKAAAGTPAVNIYIYDGVSTNGPLVCNLTTSWQRFLETATLDAAATGVQVSIGGDNSWVEADGAIDVWGGSLYPLDQDARLHKAPLAANSNANGQASLDVWPRLRASPPDFSAVITASAKGLWRLANNQVEWDVNEALQFGLGFSALEAL